MTRTVHLSIRALRDRDRLAGFLLERSPTASMKALAAIEHGLRLLKDFPESGAIVVGDLREWLIPFGRDGYVVRYRINAERVFITRIFHTLENR